MNMAWSVLKCYGCKEKFPRAEIINYCPPGTKTSHNYCKKCYQEKLNKENFINEICKIFGCKTPGPIINTQRLRLQENYGYTDDTILDCLHYMFDVKGLKKIRPTLGLVTPTNVEAMLKYKRAGAAREAMMENLLNTQYNYEYIDIKENEEEEVILDNINDYL